MAVGYSLEDAMASRDAAVTAADEMMAKRNKQATLEYKLAMDEYNKQQAELEEEKRLQEDNWLGMASKGAGMGAAFGPYGALVGGIVGTGVGMAQTVANKRERGEGWGEALGSTVFDPRVTFNKRTLHTIGGATPVAGSARKPVFGEQKAADANTKYYDAPGVGSNSALSGDERQALWWPEEKGADGAVPEDSSSWDWGEEQTAGGSTVTEADPTPFTPSDMGTFDIEEDPFARKA